MLYPRSRYLGIVLLLMMSVLSFACAKQSTAYPDAVEIKLKCRELADQMLATMPNSALEGFVAAPTSFVNINDSDESTALGRLLGESMYYEFNQRGFPTREYRLTPDIARVSGRDDLALSFAKLSPQDQQWAAVLVGTYVVDREATFVNARLVRAQDGLVLRTGQLVIANTPIILRLAEESWSGSNALYPSFTSPPVRSKIAVQNTSNATPLRQSK